MRHRNINETLSIQRERKTGFLYKPSSDFLVRHLYLICVDYTTIQRMTIPRLTKWRPDFDILMIQRLFFLKKKAKKIFIPHGFHLKTFPTPHGCQKGLKLPLTGFSYPWRELIFSLKKLFLTPNLLQIGKNGLN